MWRRALVFFCIGMPLLALAAVVVALWLLHDEAWVRDRLERAVQEETGRDLEIAGGLDIDLGRTTRLEVRGVTLSNAQWAADAPMLEAERLAVVLDVPALLQGRLELMALETDGCRVRLSENADGAANWDLLPEPPEGADEGEGWGLSIRRLQAKDCRLSHDGPMRRQPLMLELTAASLELAEDRHYGGEARGSLDGQPFSLEGSAGPVDALVHGGRFEHELSLQAGAITLTSEGSVADARRLAEPDLELRFTGPEFRVVTRYLALPPVSEGAFDFNARIDTKGDSITIEVAGDLGSLELRADGAVDRLTRPEHGELDVQFYGPDLGAVARTLGIEGVEPQPFRLDATVQFEDGRTRLGPTLFSTDHDQLEVEGDIGRWPGVEDSAVTVKLWSSDLGRWGPALRRDPVGLPHLSIQADVAVDDAGALKLQFDARQDRSELAFDGSLGTVGGDWRPRGDLRFDSPDAADLVRFLGYPAKSPLPVAGGMRFDWSDKGVALEALDAEVAGNTVQAEGLLTPAAGFRGSRLEGRIAVPDTAALGRRLGVADVPRRPLEVGFELRPQGEGLAFEVTDGALGQWRVSASGSVETLEPFGGITAEVELGLPSLRLLGDLLPADWSVPDLPVALSGRVGGTGSVIEIDDASLSLGDAQFEGRARLDTSGGLAGSWIELAGDGPDWTVVVPAPDWLDVPRSFRLDARYRRAAGAHVVERLDVAAGEFSVTADGQVGTANDELRAELALTVSGPDAAALHPALRDVAAGASFEAEGELRGGLADFTVTGIQLRVDRSPASGQPDQQLGGEIRVQRGERLRLTGDLESPWFDLEPLLKQAEDGPAEPAEDDGRVFASTPVAGFLPAGLELDLGLRVAEVDVGHSQLHDFESRVWLEDRLLRLGPLSVRGPQGSTAAGRLSLDARQEPSRVEASLEGRGLHLNLAAAEGQPVESYPPLDIDLAFTGSGPTVRAVAASLDGRLRIFQGPGRIANSRVTLLFSDFLSELFTLLNPFADGTPYTEIDCAVVGAEAKNGRVEVAPVVIRTRELTVLAEGVIDLDTEAIDLEFNTRPRSGIGISAGNLVNPFVKVGGTLADPAVELDPAKAVLTGGAAVATAGLSLLAKPVLDRFLGSADPCEEARAQLAASAEAD